MADTTYTPKVYKKAGGDTLVVASGGSIEVEPGGVIDYSTPVAAGSTLAVTKALHHGRIIALDTATGSTCTLPAATGTGAIFRFVVSVTPTSNAHVVKVTTTDVMYGQAFGVDDDGAPGNAWATASDSDTITMDSSTKGGEIGDWIQCIDIASAKWAVTGWLTQSGTEATPFSAAVS